MIYPTQTITLKNGKTAKLRSPLPADADRLMDCMIRCSQETHFLLRYPEERKIDTAQEETILQNLAESPSNLMICCEIDGRIVGNCALNSRPGIKTGHKASLAISIFEEYWGLGIGRQMFDALIRTAKACGFHLLTLEFIEGNERARALYEKVGFTVYGVRPKSIRLKDGTLLSEYCMYMEI